MSWRPCLDEKYREFVDPGKLKPEFSSDSDNVHYVQEGNQPSWIIQEMLECEPELADRLASYLSEADKQRTADGDHPLYDSSCSYEFSDPSGLEFEMVWREFCERIKHQNRFFDPEAKALLDEVFAGIHEIAPGLAGSLTSEITGEDENEPRIFRARLAHNENDAKRFCLEPVRELGAPPARLSRPGRMNPAGVRMFYAATDPETCLAELRCGAGDTVVVAEFKPLRPLRLFDLSAFWPLKRVSSYFDPKFQRWREQMKFFEKFREEVCRPIRDGDELVDYIPTQAVAEYLSKQFDPPIDGLMFRSSQIVESTLDEIDFERSQHGPSLYPEEKTNIALFQHSCEVKPQDAENRKGTAGDTQSEPSSENDPGRDEDAHATGRGALWSVVDNYDLLDFTTPPPLPSLGLIADSVRVVEVRGVFIRASFYPSDLVFNSGEASDL